MASLTYDGRTFMIDGRRFMLVGGEIDHALIPPDEWPDRLHAARLAGLTTISTRVFWSLCEPRPGAFDFSGRADVRRFIQLAGEAGLNVILRPGPFVGGGWDLGGIPTWLARQAPGALRSSSAAFLEASSRYIAALSDQLRDLQVTAQGKGGPIILMEQEHNWTCGEASLSDPYLLELARYFRESGFTVPAVNSNNLWHAVEGQIDGWTGEAQLFMTARQLGVVRPDQPRLVIDFPVPARPRIGEDLSEIARHPLELVRAACEAAAAGAFFNESAFVGGMIPGFWGGRDHRGLTSTAPDPASSIDSAGCPTAVFGPLRRLSLFLGTFGRALTASGDETPSIVADPSNVGDTGDGATVISNVGAQGGVAWVFGPTHANGKRARSSRSKGDGVEVTSLVMPDGAVLDVPVGGQGVTWCLLNTHLGGRATLDHSNLCVLTAGHGMLVAFGPPGADGEISINGTGAHITVPSGAEPHVELVEEIAVIVVNEETADRTFLTRDACYVGIHSVTAMGDPVPLPATSKPYFRVSPEATVESIAPGRPKTPPKIVLSPWTLGSTDPHATGESQRFATIDGPADLETLGVPRGYGWYRATFKLGAAKRSKIGMPACQGRFQFFIDGKPAGVIGAGPDANHELSLSFKRGDRTLVILAENPGRLSEGSNLGELTGVTHHPAEVTPLKAGKPQVVEDEPVDPLSLSRPIMQIRRGDTTTPGRVRWTIAHRRKTTLGFSLGPVPTRGVVLINGEPETYLDAGASTEVRLDADRLHRGNNTIDFAPIADPALGTPDEIAGEAGKAMASALRVVEITGEPTAKAAWAFAKWEPPAPSAFAEVSPSEVAGQPAWWRASFDAAPAEDRPLVLSLRSGKGGMTKGQVYLNGEHVCRYFVATPSGGVLPGPPAIDLPASLLRRHGNELTLFDEHGGDPTHVQLAVDRSRRRIRAGTSSKPE